MPLEKINCPSPEVCEESLDVCREGFQRQDGCASWMAGWPGRPGESDVTDGCVGCTLYKGLDSAQVSAMLESQILNLWKTLASGTTFYHLLLPEVFPLLRRRLANESNGGHVLLRAGSTCVMTGTCQSHVAPGTPLRACEQGPRPVLPEDLPKEPELERRTSPSSGTGA